MDGATNDYLQAIGVQMTVEDIREGRMGERQQSYVQGLEKDYNRPKEELAEILNRAMEEHARNSRSKIQIRKPFG